MTNRIEIEQAENGFSVKVWDEKDKEDMEDDYGYHKPKTYVASKTDEIVEIINNTFKKE